MAVLALGLFPGLKPEHRAGEGFIMIHTIKGFRIADETEVDVFLEFTNFLYDPANVGNLVSDCLSFSKPNLDICKF